MPTVYCKPVDCPVRKQPTTLRDHLLRSHILSLYRILSNWSQVQLCVYSMQCIWTSMCMYIYDFYEDVFIQLSLCLPSNAITFSIWCACSVIAWHFKSRPLLKGVCRWHRVVLLGSVKWSKCLLLNRSWWPFKSSKVYGCLFWCDNLRPTLGADVRWKGGHSSSQEYPKVQRCLIAMLSLVTSL